MIGFDFVEYKIHSLNDFDEYGFPKLGTQERLINMCIRSADINITENIKFKDVTYIGLTFDDVTEKDYIEYQGNRLKVLYTQKGPRYTQVYLTNV